MTDLKRTSKVQIAIPDIIVAAGDQALPTGSLNTTGTAMNLANGQVGVVSHDFNGTKTMGNYLTNDTASQVSAIRVVGGTPASNNTQNADLWEVGDTAFLKSGVIYADKIRSVHTRKARYGQYGGQSVTSIPTIVDNTPYSAKLRMLSTSDDKYYGDNDNVFHVGVPAIDFTAVGITQKKDYVVQNLVDQINSRSKVVGQNSAFRKGNKNVVAFGVNVAGGAGVALGTITLGTSVPFITKNGVTSNFVFDYPAVVALAQLVNSSADLTVTSTIQLVNATAAGAAATVDAFIVLGLPRTRAAYYDNIEQVQTRIEVNLGDGFLTSALKAVVTKCLPDEGTNQGSKFSIASRDRYLLTVHTMQNHPHGEWFLEGKDYINTNKLYASEIIEYYDTETEMSSTIQSPKYLYLLLPCEKASAFVATVANIVTRIAAGNTPIQMIISNDAGTGTASVNTVAGLNTTLNGWLESARVKYGFELGGEATIGGTYLV